MADHFTRFGKQILRNGEDFAQGASEEAAQAILEGLRARTSIADYLDSEGRNKRRSTYFRRLIRVLADNVRSRLDVTQAALEDGKTS